MNTQYFEFNFRKEYIYIYIKNNPPNYYFQNIYIVHI